MALPKYIDTRAPQYVRQAAPHKPIPKFTAGAANVTLNPAGKKYLAARTGHPGFKGNLTPAAAFAATRNVTTTQPQKIIRTATRTGSRSGSTKVAVTDPMTRIVNRMIADMLTPKQQAAQAQQSVDAQIKLALAGMRSSTLAEQEQAKHQAARAQQYAMALGSLRDMSGLQTEADYTNAAQRIQGLGTGLTGTIADSQQAGANQAAAQIAAATQGLGQAQGLDVEGMKNIAQYTGVAMPATNLYSEAANRAGQARLDQDVRAAKVGNIAQDYLQKGTEAQQELQRKRIELEQTRPSLYTQALQSAQGSGNSNVATIISALALQNTAAKTPSEIAENTANAGKSKATGAAATTNAATGAAKVTGITKDGNLVGGFYFNGPGTKTASKIPSGMHLYDGDPTGHVIVPNGEWHFAGKGMTNPVKIPFGYMLDPKDPTNHRIVLNPKAGAKGTGNKGTAKQIQSLVKTWSGKFDKEMDMENSPYAKNITDPLFADVKPAQWVPKKTYAAAKADMIRRLPPALKNNKQMLANIDTSLQRVGYKIPKAGGTTKATGKGGKPTKTTAADWAGAGRGKAPGQA